MDEIDYEKARKELEDAMNDLRKFKKEKEETISYEKSERNEPYCSFCGKYKGQVKLLISGPSVHICNECVRICQQLVDKHGAENE